MATCFAAETPSAALLVLNKGNNTLAIVDPVAMKVVARVPAGRDPHEVVASKGLAFISNYGGNNTLSVVDFWLPRRRCRPLTSGLCAPRTVWPSPKEKSTSRRRPTKSSGAMTRVRRKLTGYWAWGRSGRT